MTRQCAVSYYDKESFGYVIGSDSASKVYDNSGVWFTLALRLADFMSKGLASKMTKKKGSQAFSDKSFSGKNYIGFHAGSASSWTTKKASPSGALRTLDDVFGDIYDGAVYGDISIFRDVPDYSLLIAKSGNNSVELYTVVRGEGNASVARRLHRLNPDSAQSEQGSRVWYKPEVVLSPEDTLGGYWQEALDKKLVFLSAKARVIESLTNPPIGAGDYSPGELILYRVNPQEIARV